MIKINEFNGLRGEEYIHFRFSFLINFAMGFIMFLIRASETNFYRKLFCRYKKQNLDNSVSNDIKTVFCYNPDRKLFRKKSTSNCYYSQKYEFGIHVLYSIRID
jgi:hypothetical protein